MRNLFSQFLSSKCIKSCPPSTYEDVTSNSVKLLCIFIKLTWTTVDRVSSIAMDLLLSKIYQTDFGEVASHKSNGRCSSHHDHQTEYGQKYCRFPSVSPSHFKDYCEGLNVKASAYVDNTWPQLFHVIRNNFASFRSLSWITSRLVCSCDMPYPVMFTFILPVFRWESERSEKFYKLRQRYHRQALTR